MCFLILSDGISFVRTLTRNVLSLWDEVSSPSQADSSLFSQSEVGSASCDMSKHSDKVYANFSFRDTITKSKSRKRLTFVKKDEKATSHEFKEREDLPSADVNKLSTPGRINRYGTGLAGPVYVPSFMKNYTFPVYMHFRSIESRLSSMIEALNITSTHPKDNKNDDTVALKFVNRNNNSYKCLSDRTAFDHKTPKSDETSTLEFENDIKFLSSVPNKTSTPIKNYPQTLPQQSCPPINQTNSHKEQTENTLRINWPHQSPAKTFGKFQRHSFGFFYGSHGMDRLRDYWTAAKIVNCTPPGKNVEQFPSVPYFQKEPENRLIFSSEDEEAVYYLITKYLND